MSEVRLFRSPWAIACSLCAAFAAVSAAAAADPAPPNDAVASAASPHAFAVVSPDVAAERFETHCYSCHGYGGEEGGLSFEKLVAGDYGDDSLAKWEAVWKNLRSQTMPPVDEERPPVDWQDGTVEWIAQSVFQLDPQAIDPGHVVLRRLNREEYRNTIHELLNVSFDPSDTFPADDTGYGFDTVGEVLNISPMLLEKYFAAADEVVDEFMPFEGPKPPEKSYWTDHWRLDKVGGKSHMKAKLHQAAHWFGEVKAEQAGRFRVRLEAAMDEAYVPSDQSAEMVLRRHTGTGGQPLDKPQELARLTLNHETHNGGQPFGQDVELELAKGKSVLSIELIPGNTDTTPTAEGHEPRRYEARIHRLINVGPLGGDQLEYAEPAKWRLVEGPPPSSGDAAAFREHTRAELRNFATKAYRRPIDEPTLERLTELAIQTAAEPGKRYEHGLAAAFKAILSSPRFLFRIDVPADGVTPSERASDAAVPIDDYSLAVRMSYFLWSRCPDQQLLDRAKAGNLRDHLDEEIDRLIDDKWRFPTGMDNFVGQWLQTRDVDQLDFDIRYLTREVRTSKANKLFPYRTRESFREETEHAFRFLFTDDRPIEEFLNADYTFLDETLQQVYGLPSNLKSVDGKPIPNYGMVRVQLPEGSHRGGILRQGSMLMVTSNPTRTSPVKRGLFILENLLGTPAPPAPADVPELEAAKASVDESAPLRTLLEAHRANPECAGCHSRMDPLGLALENFDPLGRWQDEVPKVETHRWTDWKAEPAKAIDPSGQLMTGESFANVDELADILATDRKRDFYRCLTEKMLTYALGRGLTYRDGPAIDAIVDEVEAAGGSGRTLLKAIIKSVPFTHMTQPSEAKPDTLARRGNDS